MKTAFFNMGHKNYPFLRILQTNSFHLENRKSGNAYNIKILK